MRTSDLSLVSYKKIHGVFHHHESENRRAGINLEFSDSKVEEEIKKLEIAKEKREYLVIEKPVLDFINQSFSGIERWKATSLYIRLISSFEFEKETDILMSDLALKLGARERSVSKILKDFSNAGIIDLKAKRDSLGRFSCYSLVIKSTLVGQLRLTIGHSGPTVPRDLRMKNPVSSSLKSIKNTIYTYSNLNLNKKRYNKEKEYFYTEILRHWNEQKVIEHKSFKSGWDKIVDSLLKTYSLDEVKKGISVYGEVYRESKNKNTFFGHRWTLGEFLQRKNGLEVFVDKSLDDYLTEHGKKFLQESQSWDFNKGEKQFYLRGELIRTEKI